MGFLVSPGVDVNEIDLTNVIPAVSTSIGGYAGPFRWGPVDQIVTVSSEKDLVSVYGKPNALFAESFFTAASFLKYGTSLKVSRACDDNTMLNAVTLPPIFAILQLKSTASISSTSLTVYEVNPAIATGNNVSVTIGTTTTTYTITGTPTTTAATATVAAFTTFSITPAVSTTAIPAGSDLTFIGGSVSSPSTGILIKSSEDFASRSDITSTFVARHPGVLGNGLNVVVVTNSSTSNTTVAPNINPYALQFDYRPDVDEIHILIIDYSGVFTGIAGSVLEKYTGLSTVSTSKRADGTNNYYKDVLNASSSYVFAGVAVLINTTSTAGIAQIYDFTGGVESTPASLIAGTSTALELFADAELVDVNLIFAYGTSAGTSASAGETKLQLLSTTRKDCVAFISAPITISTMTSESTKLGLITAKFSSGSLTRNSYSVFDSSPLYVYNKYLDNYLWIPACGHMAGLCANTDDVAEPWFSPAGYTRGQLFGVTKLGFNPNQASRDTIYKLGVNPICAFPGQGTILFGDKTAQAKPSAFDRINVRRLFIVLEKAIATASKYQLFELNDEFTRAMFRNMVEPFLRDVKGRRGITDFLVVCDETNNTGEVIDTNRFVADIYIKPARSINFITLNFIATRTGVEFSEIVGK